MEHQCRAHNQLGQWDLGLRDSHTEACLMKRILLASAVYVTLAAAAPAVAADIRVPAYRPAPPPVYIFNWTGCYAGGNVGYLWVEKDFTFLNRPIGQRERQQRGRGPASWLQLSVCGRMGGWHPG